MSSELSAIEVHDLSKRYQIYRRPSDRLKQMLAPKVRRLIGLPEKAYFSEHRAVRSVSFNVPRGQTVGIIGRNGSGKSTLLQMICGTLSPSSGRVVTNGRITALLELGAGFSPDFTGRENVKLNCSILGMSDYEIEDRFAAIEKFADIGIFIDQPVKTYSSGMYVRLAFAVAINADPDIVIIDEALAVGDEAFQRKCFSRIEQIKKKGATILFVSHGSQTILQLCDRAILMDCGEAILDGDPPTVVKQYQRLVGASPQQTESVRRSIIQLGDSNRALEPAPEAKEGFSSAPTAAPEDDHAWFDENMPKPDTVEIGGEQTRIKNARIETLEGKQVNVLTSGRPYVYKYEVGVDVEEHGRSLAFGMLIKAANGIELGGVGTNLRDDWIDIETIPAVIEVAMKFQCNLAPAVYFMNAGTGYRDEYGETHLLHRILDICAFRVICEKKILFSSHVDFGIGYEVKVTTGARGGSEAPHSNVS